MMKAKIINSEKEIELPGFFSHEIREDIAQKFYELEKEQQPYGPNPESGKHHSASGRIRHIRHKWRTGYGKGISRVPRKIFWRRGDQFYWQGAEVSSTRGGRAAHPPKMSHFQARRKMNKKEAVIAIQSALASTASLEFLKKRYMSLENTTLKMPMIISSESLKLKTKEFYKLLENAFGELMYLILKKKEQRAGKGKARGRRYRENAGLLLVIGKDENLKIQGIDIRPIGELEIEDLWPLGRLTIYTESAIKQLNDIK
jgi:large subunit ribosomal protein L4e